MCRGNRQVLRFAQDDNFEMGQDDDFVKAGDSVVMDRFLEQKPNLRGVVERVRGGLFLRKKPLGDSASHSTNSAFAIDGSQESLDGVRRIPGKAGASIIAGTRLTVFTFSVLALAVAAHVSAQAQDHPEYNYDEKSIPPYTVLDPLKLADGQPVKDAKTWYVVRRPQILRIFEEDEYGRTPAGAHVPLSSRVTEEDANAFGGAAVRRQVTLYFTPLKEAGVKMRLLMYLPAHAAGRVPVILGLNFAGNQSVDADPGIALGEVWSKQPQAAATSTAAAAQPAAAEYIRAAAAEKTRGIQAQEWQVEKIIAHGYGFATAYYGDIEPDFAGGIQYGVRPLFYRKGQTAPAPNEWGAFAAWAWGLSRAVDYLDTDSKIDPHRIAVTGHSRLGKSADWAAAQDLRFAAVLSTESGKGGQSLLHRYYGEPMSHLVDPFGYWFCGNFAKWVGRDQETPFDGNLMLSLIAPRLLYVASAEGDRWSDPHGEFLSAVDVGRVYQLLGKQGLGTDQMPGVDQPVPAGFASDVAYHIRTGKHDVTEYDWDQYLRFLDAHWKAPSAPRRPGAGK